MADAPCNCAHKNPKKSYNLPIYFKMRIIAFITTVL